jgi:hypothetical protein
VNHLYRQPVCVYFNRQCDGKVVGYRKNGQNLFEFLVFGGYITKTNKYANMNNHLNLSPMAAALSKIAAQLPDILVSRNRSGDKRVLCRQYRALDQQIRRYVPAPPEQLPLIVVYDQPVGLAGREPKNSRRVPPRQQRGLVLQVHSRSSNHRMMYELNVNGSYVEQVLAEYGVTQALVCGMTMVDGAAICFLGLFNRNHIDHLVLLRAAAPVFVPFQNNDCSSSTLAALHNIVRLADPDRLQLLEVFAPPGKVATELSPALVRWLHSEEGKTAPSFRGPSLRRGHKTAAILN